MTTSVSGKARPFVKWAGGKTQLLRELSSCSPHGFSRYFEPFLGSGALFFHLDPSRAVLNDSNEELVNCYSVVRDDVEGLIAHLRSHKNEPEYFYHVRAQDPSLLSEVERASRVIFLNRTCFNGLYRVNRSNQFNTPFGRYSNPKICDVDGLRAASEALHGAALMSTDYSNAVKDGGQGDFVYLDPPYLPVSKYSDFKRYTKDRFHQDDHVRLANLFRELDERGCHVMLSNSYHPLVLELYKGFRIDQVTAKRLINKVASKRHGIPELIVRNY